MLLAFRRAKTRSPGSARRFRRSRTLSLPARSLQEAVITLTAALDSRRSLLGLSPWLLPPNFHRLTRPAEERELDRVGLLFGDAVAHLLSCKMAKGPSTGLLLESFDGF